MNRHSAKISDTLLVASIGTAVGASLGLSTDIFLQHVEHFGWAATFFGSRMGLLNIDYGEMSKAGLLGSGLGAVGTLTAVTCLSVNDKLISRRQAQQREAAPTTRHPRP